MNPDVASNVDVDRDKYTVSHSDVGRDEDSERKLCVVLSSVYPTNHSPHECILWNKEVDDDFATVTRVLSPEYAILDVRIPVEMGRLSSLKLLQSTIQSKLPELFPVIASSSPPKTDCHIVLNTHGTPGFFDLTHCIILELFKILLLKSNIHLGQVRITQISALMCDGMAAQTTEDASTRAAAQMRTSMVMKPVNLRESTMSVLQKKLMAMRCTPGNGQAFAIYGLERAYEPSVEESTVRDILLGSGGQVLRVVIPECEPHDIESRESLLECIFIIKAYKGMISEDLLNGRTYSEIDYTRAGNLLSKVMNDMKDDAVDYLSESNEHQYDVNNLLPFALALQGHLINMDIPDCKSINALNFERVYRDWLKFYKLYSPERLSLLEEYINSSF